MSNFAFQVWKEIKVVVTNLVRGGMCIRSAISQVSPSYTLVILLVCPLDLPHFCSGHRLQSYSHFLPVQFYKQ